MDAHEENIASQIGDEPNLEEKVYPFNFTYGDLKKQAELEATTAWQSGKYTIHDNPFNEGSPSNKWWNDKYVELDA